MISVFFFLITNTLRLHYNIDGKTDTFSPVNLTDRTDIKFTIVNCPPKSRLRRDFNECDSNGDAHGKARRQRIS